MQNNNIILDTIDISNESGTVTEPVTLAEMNQYLRQNGFVDDNDITAIGDFTDDNDLIEEIITAARQYLEEKLGISIVSHTWQAIGATNEAGNLQLRYGPGIVITAIEDSDGTAYDHTDTDIVKMQGDYLKYPNDCDMVIEYTSGYTTVPKPLVLEIKRCAAYLYEHRGDEAGVDGYKISSMAAKYSRISWLV